MRWYSSRLVVLVGAFVGLSSLPAPGLLAAEKGNIRFYELNKREGEIRIRARDSDTPGCHNFRRNKPLHRVAMVGYAWCSVFSEKDCAAGSELAAMWQGRRYRHADIDISQPQTRLYRGSKWMFTNREDIDKNDARRYAIKPREEQRKARDTLIEQAHKRLQDYRSGELSEEALRQYVKSLTRKQSRPRKLLLPNDLKNPTESSTEQDIETSQNETSQNQEVGEHVEAQGTAIADPVSETGKTTQAEKDTAEKVTTAEDTEIEIENPEEALEEALVRLKKENELIIAAEKGYIPDMQRNVTAASWYCLSESSATQ